MSEDCDFMAYLIILVYSLLSVYAGMVQYCVYYGIVL